jgi:hypothetical protein
MTLAQPKERETMRGAQAATNGVYEREAPGTNGQRRTPSVAGVSVPLLVRRAGPATTCQPITVGLPFPRGALTAAEALVLLDGARGALPLQTCPLARWSDGSIKWLLLDTLLPPEHGESLRLAAGQDKVPAPPLPGALCVREGFDAITVDTGTARFHLDRGRLLPFTRVVLNDRDALENGGCRLVLSDARGREGTPVVRAVALEASGPVRATVRLEGTFGGRVPARFVARLCFFAGNGLVRLRLTLHNPRRARHPGGLWDLGDRGSLFFRDLSLGLAVRGRGAPRLHWSAEVGQPAAETTGRLEIYQDSSGGANWMSKNHVNRQGKVPCSFRGYRVRAGGAESVGLRASPLLCVEGDAGPYTVAVP